MLMLIFVGTSYSQGTYSVYLKYEPTLTASSVDTESSKLQSHGETSQYGIEVQRLLVGSKFFLGIGYMSLSKNYTLFINGVGPQQHYSLEHSYLLGRLGYIFELNSIRIKPSILFGVGKYQFMGDIARNEKDNAYIYAFNLNAERNFGDSNFSYIFGLGYVMANYSNINQNNLNIDSRELTGDFNLNFALGYSF
jgi:hypothetical protein